MKRKILSFCLIFAFLLTSLQIVPFEMVSAFDETTGRYFPKSPNPPDHVYAINTGHIPKWEAAMVTTLQGLLAKNKPEIFTVTTGKKDGDWMKELTEQYGVTFEECDNAWDLIDRYKDRINGYILYDAKYLDDTNAKRSNAQLISNSIHVATSLAGIMNAVIVETGMEETAKAHGLTKVFDATGKDINWLLDSEYYPKLRKDLAFEVENLESYYNKMRDYAVMTNSLMFFPEDDAQYKRILESLEPNTPILGWGKGGEGEANFVYPANKLGKFFIPAHTNMSFFSGFQIDNVKQLTHDQPVKADPTKHYVCLFMSDGGNLGYTMNGLESQKRLFDNSFRGQVDLAWAIPAPMLDIAPTITKSLYDRSSNGEHKDQFVLQQPGGYVFPGAYKPDLVDENLKRIDRYMDKLDMSTLAIIGFGDEKDRKVWDSYTKLEHLKAVFFLDYLGYMTPHAKILWSNGKPIIPSKQMFKEGYTKDEDVINAINSAPTDPTSSDGYTLVSVHAWSKSVEQVKEQLVDKLADHVEVVTPETFVNLIYDNVKRDEVVDEDNTKNIYSYEFKDDMNGWKLGKETGSGGSGKWVFNGSPGGGLWITGSGTDRTKPNAWFYNTFDLPSDTKTLEFDTRTRGSDFGGLMRVRVKDQSGNMQVVSDWKSMRSPEYVKNVLDLSKYAGQKVEIYFEQLASDKKDSEQIYLDNIKVKGTTVRTPINAAANTSTPGVEPIIIDNGGTGKDIQGPNTFGSGEWKKSTALKGADNSSTLYSETPGAWYKWFKMLEKGEYEVFIYKISGKGDPEAAIEVGQGTEVLGTTKLDFTKGDSDWVSLGKYNFDGTSEAYVKNTLSSKGSLTRADAVKFQRIGGASSEPAPEEDTVENEPAPNPEGISVKINGKLQNYDQPPMIINDRTMVPLRGIFEALGATISWDEDTETVTANKEDITVTLKIGDSKAFVKGSEKILDQPAQLVNGRTLVPIRFIGEALGAKVDWDENSQTVIITVAGM